jgi:protein-tyrosine kinase
VSRLDEALRRLKSDDPPVDPEAQEIFTPAWPVPRRDAGESEENAPRHGRIAQPARPAGPLSFSSEWRERIAAGSHGNPGLIEQFRRLATTLHHAHQANGIRSVMVTSATAGDGKTLTAINLSLVLAESYRYNVLLIDADLRRPSIPSVVEMGQGSGLSEALRSATEQKLALVPITSRLTLLPAGQPIANSLEALTSPRMQQILEEAVTRFDWVILDAPPVGPAADARLLAQMVDGALFVIRAGVSQHPMVQKAIEGLGKEHIVGVVLNGVESDPTDGYYYGVSGANGKG